MDVIMDNVAQVRSLSIDQHLLQNGKVENHRKVETLAIRSVP